MKEIKHIRTFTDCLEQTDRVRNKIQEHFGVILLNSNHDVIANKVLFKGGVNLTTVDFKIVFYYAVKHLTSAMIIYHNHPSGNPEPSEQDIELTKKLKEACKIMGISLLDHLIVPRHNYNALFSFRSEFSSFFE